MADVGDFLYSTMDVAIWSTVEVGIGIVASAAATLRPLFRVFFAGSKAVNGGSSAPTSNHWPKSGYIRSRGTNEAFALRSDISKTGGVTTVIQGDVDMESGHMKRESHDGNANPGGWNNSDAQLRGNSSDEEPPAWRGGIVKTTGMTQTRN
jgi:hypothetical protein